MKYETSEFQFQRLWTHQYCQEGLSQANWCIPSLQSCFPKGLASQECSSWQGPNPWKPWLGSWACIRSAINLCRIRFSWGTSPNWQTFLALQKSHYLKNWELSGQCFFLSEIAAWGILGSLESCKTGQVASKHSDCSPCVPLLTNELNGMHHYFQILCTKGWARSELEWRIWLI